MKDEKNKYPLYGFAERLKLARHKKGIGKKKLCSRVGISRESLSNYEGGYSTPNLTIVAKLAKELDVSLDYLAYGKQG